MTAPPLHGFAPLANDDASILILGSMPSAASLQQAQYYGHPRNRFWPLMERLFGVEAAQPYRARCRQLTATGVAVWDVLRECRRSGSLDSAIVPSSMAANDIGGFLEDHPRISHVFLNGGLAGRLYRQRIHPGLGRAPAAEVLPSTSPANARWSLDRLHARWEAAAAALGLAPHAG